MNKNFRIGMMAAVAIPVILLVGYQGMASSQEQQPTAEDELAVFVDFSIWLENRTIILERGETVSVPLKIQAPNDAEKTLRMSLLTGPGNADPEQFNARLSKASVVLSQLDVADGKVKNLAHNIGERPAGTLTVTAPANMEPGTYRFAIEAEAPADGVLADAVVAGTIVTIQVK